MSAVLKSQGTHAARPFAGRAPESVPAAPVSDPRDEELAALRATVDRLTRALAEARADAEQTADRARDEGRAAGLTEAEGREAQRLAALQKTLVDASAVFRDRLDLVDGLAPQLARVALEKLFTDPAQWATMVEAMLARQLDALRRSSIVAIHVSPHDFAEVAPLASTLGSEASRIVRDPELASGACRIACTLGQIDLDVREQWSALAAVLDAMGEEG